MSRDDDAVTEEEDILGLLATESEDAENEDDDGSVGSEVPETLEEALDALAKSKETINKRNVSLKKAKAAQHRTQEEKDAFVTRLDALEQRGNGQQPNVEAENLAKEEQEMLDRVEDDPTQMPVYLNWKNKQLEGRLATFLEKKFSEFDGSIQELRVSPDKTKYAKEIKALKTRAGFENLPDDTLLEVIKGQENAKVKKPRGGIGGTKGVSDTSTEAKATAEDIAMMGF